MTPVMLRAKSGSRPTALLGSDDEEVLSAALETSTPNRHTFATSKQRTALNNGAETAMAETSSSSSMQSRRYHSKSLSLSEGKTLSKAFETPALRLCTFSGSSQLFQQNRSMWEKRAEPEGNSNGGGGGGSVTTISVVTTTGGDAGGDRNSRNAAPDLVLDLPTPLASAGTDNNVVAEVDQQQQQNHHHNHHHNPQPGSPDAEEMGGGGGGGGMGMSGSGADCFAHNQFTLKKNDKFLLLESSRQNFSMPDNNNKEQQQPGSKETTSSSVLHISEEEEQMQMQQRQQQQQLTSLPTVVAPETVIAERNTHKFITQFADLKLTGGSLPMPGGGAGTTTSSGSLGGGEGSASELIGPFKPILRREKPQILRKPVLASSSSTSSTNSGPSSLMSFCAKGSSSSDGGDDISGTKSLE